MSLSMSAHLFLLKTKGRCHAVAWDFWDSSTEDDGQGRWRSCVLTAERSEIYFILLCVSKGSTRDCSWMECFRKEVPNGTWKSLLCFRRANKSGWVIALFCCSMLGSDEKGVPVVKKAKDQVCQQWRGSRTLIGVTKMASHSACSSSRADLRGRARSSTCKWLLSRGWLRAGKYLSLAAGLEPSVKVFCFANLRFADCLRIAVVGHSNSRNREVCSCFQWLRREQTVVFAMKMGWILLAGWVHLATQSNHCLFLAGQLLEVWRQPVWALPEESWLSSRVLGDAASTGDGAEQHRAGGIPRFTWGELSAWNCRRIVKIQIFHHSLKNIWGNKRK